MMENAFRYGFIANFEFGYNFGDPYSWPMTTILSVLQIFILVAYSIEKNEVSPLPALGLHGINLVLLLVMPWKLAYWLSSPFGSTIVVAGVTSALWLKLWSFAHVNYLLKHRFQDGARHTAADEEQRLKWCNGMTLPDLYIFMAMPTLCYQVEYPRTERINWFQFARRGIIFLVLNLLSYILAAQYVYPAVKNSVIYVEGGDYVRLAERVLKTAVPNLYVWLLGFYTFFEVFLNMMADVTCFADCRFYADWWNSRSLGYYWRSWNLPVHNWVKRHLYQPIMVAGYGKWTAVLVSFFVSAFFHEYILSMPFNTVKLWAFVGILGQVPLIILTDPIKQYAYLGNIIFWFSIFVGQPFITFMYYHAYLTQQGLAVSP